MISDGPPRYRLLLLDFDGTLADSFPAFLKHMSQAAEHFGLTAFDPANVNTLRELSARQLIERLGIPFWKVPQVARFVRRAIAADLDQVQLLPSIVEMLSQLVSRGMLLGVVSSNSEVNVRAVLGPDISKLIHIYACGASLFGKAAKFRKVLKKTGIPAAHTLAIGDEIRDLEAAKEAGLDFGAVAWGYTKPDALATYAPAFLFRTPQEIVNVVASPASECF